MPRQKRDLQPNYSYHITVRCNNRRFNLNRAACRNVLLYAIQRAKEKYAFRLYAVCIMSNHVHYLLEPAHPQDLPKIMHWLNWYTAMSFNRMLKRTGHFWEQRYFSTGFPTNDHRRALNTLRYIHANPKAANLRKGFIYRYSNYGIYAKLGDDGLTEWHPAFLHLADTLDDCAAAYRRFCRIYQTRRKLGGRRSAWGSRQLPQLGRKSKMAPGQIPLPIIKGCQVTEVGLGLERARLVAQRFFLANGVVT